MTTEIILATIGLLTAIVGTSWITSVIQRKKYIEEVAQMKATNESTTIDNSQKIVDMLNKDIVEPLRVEVKSLRNEIKRFREAIQKIPSCIHARDNGCPVRDELQKHEGSDNGNE
ncbi:MAG: hypothetical protein LBN27_01730 [Prevotellaceae bacterium]|jgi:heme exporter protein D|nr:hypothetical protein [Prevotellaceae bacterium]